MKAVGFCGSSGWSSSDGIRIVGARLSAGLGFPNWAFGAK